MFSGSLLKFFLYSTTICCTDTTSLLYTYFYVYRLLIISFLRLRSATALSSRTLFFPCARILDNPHPLYYKSPSRLTLCSVIAHHSAIKARSRCSLCLLVVVGECAQYCVVLGPALVCQPAPLLCVSWALSVVLKKTIAAEKRFCSANIHKLRGCRSTTAATARWGIISLQTLCVSGTVYESLLQAGLRASPLFSLRPTISMIKLHKLKRPAFFVPHGLTQPTSKIFTNYSATRVNICFLVSCLSMAWIAIVDCSMAPYRMASFGVIVMRD